MRLGRYKSYCRVCKAYRIQGMHWVPTELSILTPTGTQSNSGYWEECVPSDNLEYLEYKYEQSKSTI
jgi:hypothetical protein